MQIEQLKKLFTQHKEVALFGRYIYSDSISHLLNSEAIKPFKNCIGVSVNGEDIFSITIGEGSKKILMWSQMHGNESTTTKALFDLLNFLLDSKPLSKHVLESCTIKIIPILNPDGAKAYTRLNANQIDLNRDAQDLSQPESRALRQEFETFKPDFCFNLHGQRTIFSAGNTNNPATVSFLAPAQDKDCTITENRKIAMEIINAMNTNLQVQIPNQVGIYDDAFNINCVGDTFQSHNIPTILFEAGHYPNDYDREVTRELIFQSLLVAINYIAENDIKGAHYNAYFNIPQNKKLFYDIIIRNTSNEDIGIQYQEVLKKNSIDFIPKIEKISNLSSFYAHKEFNAREHKVLSAKGMELIEGNENDFVFINNEEFSLILKKN